MDRFAQTNASYQKICRVWAIAYTAACLVILVYNIFFSTPYYWGLTAAAPLFLLVPWMLEKVARLHPNYLLHFLIHLYTAMAFGIGMVFNGYSRIPYYDKLAHTLTGFAFGMMGVILYYWLKPGHKAEPVDCGRVCWFSVSFTMLVAVGWEIFEYAINLVLHNDPQKVAETGVNDTMLDMIVCLVGALCLLPSFFAYFRKGKTGFFMKLAESFFALSIGENRQNQD